MKGQSPKGDIIELYILIKSFCFVCFFKISVPVLSTIPATLKNKLLHKAEKKQKCLEMPSRTVRI